MRLKNIYCIVLLLLSFSFISVNSQTVVSKVASIDTLLSNIQVLDLDIQFCKIDITQSTTNSFSIKGTLMSDKLSEEYKFVLSNSNPATLSLKTPASGWQSHHGELVLEVPKNVVVNIKTTSGLVHASDLNQTTLNISTRSGNVDLTTINGTVSVESASGVIRSSNVAGDLQVKTKSGAQFIDKHVGKVNCESTEGDITISDIAGGVKTESTVANQTIQRVQGNIHSKAVNGNIKISDSNGNIEVVTFAGGIKLYKTTGIANLQSTIGDQVGGRIELTGSSLFKTTEGKIKMQIENSTDLLTFDLQSTSAYIQARGTSKKKKLKMGKGSIVVQGMSTTGGQVYN